jgi:GT2 family glycosyltransferase
MESKKKVAVIIINWNGWKDTLDCLSSLKKISTAYAEISVIVVDNGSTNESVPVIRKKFPSVTVLETGKNLGFTGGNNAGIRYAMSHGSDFVWLLNNDTVVDPGVLSFVSTFDDPSVGIAGSKIYFVPGREFHHDRYKEDERGKVIWYAGGKIDWNNMYASHRGVDEVDRGQYDKITETPFVTGCSMIIRREVIAKIGLLDDRYYLYLEDLDYCLRAVRAGYKLLYVPSSVLWHVNAGSSSRPGNPLHEYYLTRNRLLIGFRYASFRTKFALLREAFRFRSPVRRKAVFDWMTGRFGNRFSL